MLITFLIQAKKMWLGKKILLKIPTFFFRLWNVSLHRVLSSLGVKTWLVWQLLLKIVSQFEFSLMFFRNKVWSYRIIIFGGSLLSCHILLCYILTFIWLMLQKLPYSQEYCHTFIDTHGSLSETRALIGYLYWNP
jgi:hypothetical protein